MSKPLVVHIGKYYPPVKGGMETSLKLLVERLTGDFRVSALVANTCNCTKTEGGGDLTVTRMARAAVVFSQPLTFSLFRRLKGLRSDIIHIHLPNPLAAVAYLVSRPKGALIVSYHAEIRRLKIFSFLYTPLVAALLKHAVKIVVTSDNMIAASPLLSRFKGKCRVIPHGIEPGQFLMTEETAREAQRIRQTAGKPIILFVGRLVRYKGLACLLKAMRLIDARLVIVGTGPLERRLKLRAKMYGVSHKVVWAGEVDQRFLPAYYHSCELFALPSIDESESFSLAMLEAQACGKAVVSAALPTGVTFVNVDGETGLTVPPRDSAAFAAAINRLLADENLRRKYGVNGQKRAHAEFTAKTMAERFVSLYRSTIKGC